METPPAVNDLVRDVVEKAEEVVDQTGPIVRMPAEMVEQAVGPECDEEV